MRKLWPWIAGGVVALVFALTVWPTLYRYHVIGPSVARENRLTGALDRLEWEGWEPMTPAPPKPATPDDPYLVELRERERRGAEKKSLTLDELRALPDEKK